MIFVGIDVAAATFTASAITAPEQFLFYGQTYANALDGFQLFWNLLQHCQITPTESFIVLEATGVYGEELSHFLYQEQYVVCVESPQKVKKAFTARGKTDPVDSRQIAEYGFRFNDRLHPWNPRARILEEVAVLLTMRDQLSRNSTASKNSRRALRRKQHHFSDAIALQTHMIMTLDTAIGDIDDHLRRLLQQESLISQHAQHLMLIPCVKLLLTANFCLLTNGFQQHLQPKQLAAYIGICPFAYESGTSVYRRPRADGCGPARVRKLLYLTTMSMSRNHPEMNAYYQRKVKEGKAKKLVMNNMANKLLAVMCAIVVSGQPYQPNFISVKPDF